MHISTFFTFFRCCLINQTAFELWNYMFVQIIVTFFHLTTFTDLILRNFDLLYYWSNWKEFFFHILSFAWFQVKTVIVKLILLPRKTSISDISLTFFINWQSFQYRLPNIVITWPKLLGLPFFNTDYPNLW